MRKLILIFAAGMILLPIAAEADCGPSGNSQTRISRIDPHLRDCQMVLLTQHLAQQMSALAEAEAQFVILKADDKVAAQVADDKLKWVLDNWVPPQKGRK